MRSDRRGGRSGVVDIVYARRGDIAERARGRAGRRVRAHRPDARHRSRDARAADRVPDRVPEAGRRRGARRPRRARSIDGAWDRAVRWWRAAPRALLEPWAGAVVNSIEAVRRVPRRGARRAPARRHRSRRRLGRRPVRAARARRSRAAAPGQAGPHAGARRRPDRRRRLRRGVPPARASSTTAASSASSTSTSPTTAGRSPTPSSGRAISRAALLTLTDAGRARPVAASPGVGMPSNATRLPGSASVTNSVRRSSPPKQQFVVRPSPSICEEVDDGAVGVDDADAVLDRRRDVEATVGVEAEAVAAARSELLDHPFAVAVGVARAASRAARRRRRCRRVRTRCRCSRRSRRRTSAPFRRARRRSRGRCCVLGRRVVPGIGEVDVDRRPRSRDRSGRGTRRRRGRSRCRRARRAGARASPATQRGERPRRRRAAWRSRCRRSG